jgi:tRNA-2-methylthio-N6-dimethylallyladenosine synthase
LEKSVDILSSNNFDQQQNYIELIKNYFNDTYGIKSKPKAYVKTFGCQQNVSDSEKIKGILNLTGYDVSDILEDCDLILYNTCAVRENAEDKVFGNIGYVKHIKIEIQTSSLHFVVV